MASLLSGLQPDRHGVERRRSALDRSVRTLPQWLAGAGYDTALVTANPQIGSFFGFGRGFGATFQLYGRRRAGSIRGTELVARGDEVAARSLAWLATANRPFALVVLAIDPHSPYSPIAPFRSRGATSRERYQAEVRAADAALGKILAELERNGEIEETAIVFTSDHGEEFGEYGRTGHGGSLVDESIQIPLVLRLPRSAHSGGTRVQEPAQLVDILPTLLDLAGIEVGAELDGTTLLAAGREERTVRASVFTPRGRLRTARRFPWKLVVGPGPRDRALFDLRSGERTPVDIALSDGAAAAEEALSAVLADRHPGTPARRTPAAPLPDDLRAALESLGYVDPNSPKRSATESRDGAH